MATSGKKKDNFSQMEENNAQALETQRQAGEQYIEQMQANQKALEEQNRAAEAELAKQNEEQEKGFREFILQQRDDYDRAIAEDKAQVEADQKKSRWGAITEALVGLANLVGVGNGASNQQIQSYSKDWMQKADENLRASQKRRDALRQQSRVLEQQLLALRSNNGKALTSLKSSNATRELAGQGAINNAVYGLNAGLAKAEAAGYNDILKARQDQSNADRNFARLSGNGGGSSNTYSIILDAENGQTTSTAYPLSKENVFALVKRYYPNEYSAFTKMSKEDQINKMRDWAKENAELNKDIRAYGRAGKANQEDPVDAGEGNGKGNGRTVADAWNSSR